MIMEPKFVVASETTIILRKWLLLQGEYLLPHSKESSLLYWVWQATTCDIPSQVAHYADSPQTPLFDKGPAF